MLILRKTTIQAIFLSLTAAIYMACAYLIFGSKIDKSEYEFFICFMIKVTPYSLLWH